MNSAPLDLVAVLVLVVLAPIVGFVGGSGSQVQRGMRFGLGGLVFLVLATVAALFLGYGRAEIEEMYLLRQAKDSFGVGSSVIVGYALLLGAVIQLARARLTGRPHHDA